MKRTGQSSVWRKKLLLRPSVKVHYAVVTTENCIRQTATTYQLLLAREEAGSRKRPSFGNFAMIWSVDRNGGQKVRQVQRVPVANRSSSDAQQTRMRRMGLGYLRKLKPNPKRRLVTSRQQQQREPRLGATIVLKYEDGFGSPSVNFTTK